MDRKVWNFALLISFSLATWSTAQDWRSWRGPNQDGSISADGYFSNGPFRLELAWQKRIGPGYSGLAVSNGRLLVPYADGENDWLAALDTQTGNLLWKFRLGPMYPAQDGGHDGPVSTPAADDESVFLLGPWGTLFAVDLDSGTLKWSINLKEKYSAKVPYWGFCSSPAVNESSLFLQVSGDSNHGIVAFDKRSGEIQWKQPLDRTDYRSPILTTINQVPQLVCNSATETTSFDPATGKQLWSVPFESSREMTPVPLGESNLLLSGWSHIQLMDLNAAKAEKKWRSNELRRTFATPVFHEQHLYGFSRHALTCVDAKSGKRVWRSRGAAGGKAIILVDNHLVIFSVTGDLIVVRATSKGYEERGRLSVSTADGYASPIFADGLVFSRDLSGELFAVRATKTRHFANNASQPTNKVESFVATLSGKTSENKQQAIDAFIRSQDSFPIIEDERLVHFVYQGPASDVAVRGSMLASGIEGAMNRVPGTDFFYRTYEMKPGTRWEYDFVVDFDVTVPDPLNHKDAKYRSKQSEFVSRDWTEPPWASEAASQSRGRLQQLKFEDESISVYLPKGYDESGLRYKLVVVLDGEGWLQSARAQNLLDQLHASTMNEPVIVALPSTQGLGGPGTSDYAELLTQKIVPAIDKQFRTKHSHVSRTIVGHRGAAVGAVYTALKYPNVFGQCGAISFGRADTIQKQRIQSLVENFTGDKPRFHISWNRYDVRRPQSFDCRQQSNELTKQLMAAKFSVSGGERNDSSNWRSWRIHLGSALLALEK